MSRPFSCDDADEVRVHVTSEAKVFLLELVVAQQEASGPADVPDSTRCAKGWENCATYSTESWSGGGPGRPQVPMRVAVGWRSLPCAAVQAMTCPFPVTQEVWWERR